MNVCAPTFSCIVNFLAQRLTVGGTNAMDCTLFLEPLQPFMQGKASRDFSTFRLISLLDSFCFPSDSSFTAWYASCQ